MAKEKADKKKQNKGSGLEGRMQSSVSSDGMPTFTVVKEGTAEEE